MHVNGLKRMVKLRGGLEEIRENNHMLANLIFGSVHLFCKILLTCFNVMKQNNLDGYDGTSIHTRNSFRAYVRRHDGARAQFTTLSLRQRRSREGPCSDIKVSEIHD